MSRSRPLTVLAVLCALLTVAIAAPTASARNHVNAYSIEGQFFCVSCHEPLNQVNSPEAQAEKSTLRQLAAQGLDMTQIKAAMVTDYGQDVLGSPPAKGFNLFLYVLPPLVIVVGLGFIVYSLPRWRRRGRALAPDRAAASRPELDPSDAERLEEELSHFDA